jgi:hypothetical protein
MANKQITNFLNRPVLTQFPIEKERSTHGKHQLQRSNKAFWGSLRPLGLQSSKIGHLPRCRQNSHTKQGEHTKVSKADQQAGRTMRKIWQAGLLNREESSNRESLTEKPIKSFSQSHTALSPVHSLLSPTPHKREDWRAPSLPTCRERPHLARYLFP